MTEAPAPPGVDVWDGFAADYEATAHPFTRLYARDAWRLLEPKPGARVLDVAAGAGALTLEALADGADVTAIDFSPGMIALLGRRLSEAGHDAARARVMDGQALEFPDAAFDAACSIFGVMLFPDPSAGLREIARVLRPGGRAVVAVWATAEGAGPLPLLYDAHRSLFPDRSRPPVSAGMAMLASEVGLAGALTEAGLTDVAVHRVAHPWAFDSATGPAKNADRMFAAARIWTESSEADRDRLRDAMTARLAALPEPVIPSEALVAVTGKPG